MKNCALCKVMKPESFFTKKSLPKIGLHSYCNQCRNLCNQKTPSYALLNKTRGKTHGKFQPILNLPEEEKKLRRYEQNRQWRIRNAEQWSIINRTAQHKRRALGSINSTEWIAKVAILKNECQKCFKTEPEIKITIDHIIPVSKGGTNHIDNLQPLCMKCNRMKSNKLVEYSPMCDLQSTP